MHLRWDGWGAERSHGICAPLPLFYCPSFPRKVINGNCAQGYEGKSITNNPSLSGWRGFTSHKLARVYNNFKIYCLLLKRKVYIKVGVKGVIIIGYM